MTVYDLIRDFWTLLAAGLAWLAVLFFKYD